MAQIRLSPCAHGWTRGEIYAGGRHLATYVDGTTYFDNGDWLGTERLRTRVDGSVYETCVSLPYGDALNCTFPNGAGTDSPLHFTGKPRDAETGLDDFGARYNSSTLGGFLTPDPAGDFVADVANPQSWNQYTYVLNNPVTLIDPTGLLYCKPTDQQGKLDCIKNEDWDALNADQKTKYKFYESTDDGKTGSSSSGIGSNDYLELIALQRAAQNTERQAWIQQQQQLPTNHDYMMAIRTAFSYWPDICSVSVQARGTLGRFALGVNVDSRAGVSGVGRVTQQVGPVGLTGAASTSGRISLSASVRIPETPVLLGLEPV